MKKLILCCLIFTACNKKDSTPNCETWSYSLNLCTGETYDQQAEFCGDYLIKYNPKEGKTVSYYDDVINCQEYITFIKRIK